MSAKDELYIRLEGQILKLTHPDKVLFPAIGFKKRDLIDYYRRAAPAVLPHLLDRPFTLKRYPSGVEGPYFHEKTCPAHRPRWVKTGLFEGIQFCLINDLKTLVWVANLASVELPMILIRAKESAFKNALKLRSGSRRF
jgi:bifunctional non-homologous end joining protein LigD